MAYLIFNSNDKFTRIAKDDSEKNLIINTHTTFKTVEISDSDFFKLKYSARSINESTSTPTNWSFNTMTDANGTTFYVGTNFSDKTDNAFFDDNGVLQSYDSSNPKHIIEFALSENDMQAYITMRQQELETILQNIGEEHVYYDKLSNFNTQLKDFNTSSISYPFQLSLLEYFDNQSLLSISPLQYPL